MNRDRLLQLLEEVKAGATAPESALQQLRNLPYEDIGFAKVDHHRHLRTGCAEVVYCPGKTPEQIAAIMGRISQEHSVVLGTRATPEVAAQVLRLIPEAIYETHSRLLLLGDLPEPNPEYGQILVMCAGTADIPVAEEAAYTAQASACPVERIYDVGVAGIHRLLAHVPQIGEASAIVVVAGMEGALPSVVAGLAACPVIAVPTSTGYGASFGGLAALLTMLNACATGISVVNIDNGFGAGYTAALISRGRRQ